MADEVTILSSKERVARFGVLCTVPGAEDLIFQNWEPGGEYIQKLRVKNVSRTLKKLKYKLPKTRYFSLAFPETIDLSPGMSVELDVVFRPVAFEAYDDTIYFKLVETGTTTEPRGFHVPVQAALKTLRLALSTTGLDMGLCPTKEISKNEFDIINIGQVDAPFEWHHDSMFLLEPSRGIVGVGKRTKITVSINPQCAKTFVSRASLRVGPSDEGCVQVPEPQLDMTLSAVGKFPHITLSDTTVDFGTIVKGAHETKETAWMCVRDISVSNSSVVPATVTILRIDRDREPAVSVNAVHGDEQFVVPAKGHVAVKILFSTTRAGSFSAERFRFATPGGNAPVLLVTGEAAAPSVRIYKKEDPYAAGKGVENSVNFGSVKVGQVSTRAIFLKNDSETTLAYQCVLADKEAADSGIFQCHPVPKLNFDPSLDFIFYFLTVCVVVFSKL